MIHFPADTKTTQASIFTFIWISLLHNVLKRVRNTNARFPCVYGTTDGYGVWQNWVGLG
jgi:hypothetical protein